MQLLIDPLIQTKRCNKLARCSTHLFSCSKSSRDTEATTLRQTSKDPPVPLQPIISVTLLPRVPTSAYSEMLTTLNKLEQDPRSLLRPGLGAHVSLHQAARGTGNSCAGALFRLISALDLEGISPGACSMCPPVYR